MSRYSLLYIERGKPTADSGRARRRLAAWCVQKFHNHFYLIYNNIQAELGHDFTGATFGRGIENFFLTSGVPDLLDAITIIFNVANEVGDGRLAASWIVFIGRVFEEETLAYRIGRAGVVHPFVDVEFEANRSAALASLDDPKFGEVRQDFEAAFRHLRDGGGKEAIRMMFPAVETAAKVLFPGKLSRLMPNEVDRIIERLRERWDTNQPARDAGVQLLGGMKTWINSSQPYRHGQEQQEPAEPPAEFVVAFLSAGAVYLRLMIELCG
jgi:hypothetical protein